MRRTHRLAAAVALACASLACRSTQLDTAPPAPSAPEGPSEPFYAALAAHGTWIDDAAYGWVWMPAPEVVGAEFFPYLSDGNWVHTDAGWMFDSAHAWGWAPFHYGRWAFDDDIGWMWLPGDEWAPAWVDWRWHDGYVGWAPLPPLVGQRSLEDLRSHWVVVAARDLTQARLDAFLQPPARAQAVFAGESTPLPAPGGWPEGPPAELIASALGRPPASLRLDLPDAGDLVRARVTGARVELTPYRPPVGPPPASAFAPGPPRFPLHVMRPEAIRAPVFIAPGPRPAR